MTSFSIQYYDNNHVKLVSSNDSIPFILIKTQNAAFASAFPIIFQYAYNKSQTFREIVADRVAKGGGIEFGAYEGGEAVIMRPFERAGMLLAGGVYKLFNVPMNQSPTWGGVSEYNHDASGVFLDGPGLIDNQIAINTYGMHPGLAWSDVANNLELKKMAGFIAHELLHPLLGPHASGAEKPSYQEMITDTIYRKGFKVFGEIGGKVYVSSGSGTSHYYTMEGATPGPGESTLPLETFIKVMAKITENSSSGPINVDGLQVLGFGMEVNGAVVPISLSEVVNLGTYGEAGSIIGSSLGNFLGGGNPLKGIVYSSLLGAIGKRLGEAIAIGNPAEAVMSMATTQGLAQFGSEAVSRMGQAAVGTVSSLLSVELGKALGLKGFGAETFDTGASTVLSRVVDNISTYGAQNAWLGFNSGEFFQNTIRVKDAAGNVIKDSFGNEVTVQGGGFLLANALGSFFGAKLGAMVVAPQTQAAAALSSIGSAVGAWVAGKLIGTQASLWLNVLAPGVGSFIGFVLGAVIGNLFGRKKPKIPSASAETVLQIPYARYELGAITVTNNGNRDLVTSMATIARDTLNNLIGMVAYTNTTTYVSNLNGYTTTQVYGHTNSQIYVKINGVQTNFASADQAVEFGTLAAIRNTKIVGGDIFAKRAIARSPAADLTSLTGDLQIASDYRFYANNRGMVNGFITGAYAALTEAEQSYYAANKALIDKTQTQGTAALTAGELSFYTANKPTIDKIIGALENQAVANPWIITLERVSELGLDRWTSSDFYGGLRGFLDSFDLKGHGVAYENTHIYVSGSAGEIQVRGQTSDGLFSLLPQAQDGFSGNDIANSHFQNNLANWTPSSWQITNPQYGVNLDGYYGNGHDVLWLWAPGTQADGIVNMTSSATPVQAGVAYDVSVKAAQHRGVAQVFVQFFDANNNEISLTFLSGTARESGAGGGDLANFNTIAATLIAPPGAVTQRTTFRLYPAGGVSTFAFFTEPVFVEAAAGKGQAVRIEDMSKVGYTIVQAGGVTSTGQDFVDRHVWTTAVTIDDQRLVQQWVPPNSHIPDDEGHYITVTREGGDDIFVGGQGADHLYGRSGWDWLDGQGGDDYLEGGDDNDVLLGGAGRDKLIGGAGDDYLAGGDGDDYVIGWTSADAGIFGGAGNDTLVGGGGNDSLLGEDGDDTFIIDPDGGGTMDWIDGGAGSDTLSFERLTGGIGVDMLWSANRSDAPDAKTIYGDVYQGIENLTGTDYADHFIGDDGANILKGGAGDDILAGRAGDDILEGGAGADQLGGFEGFDTASYEGSSAGVYVDLTTGEAFGGDAEGDTIASIENLRGSKLADQLKGDAGANRLEGLAGDDWLVATAGADFYDGGDGKDFVDYSEATSYVGLNLGGYTATSVTNGVGYVGLASYHTYRNVEGVIGSAYDDSFWADDGDQTFVGGAGNDTLSGGAGTDTYVLNVGDGADTIVEDNGGWNVLSLGDGIKVSDLIMSTSGGAGGWLSLTVRGGNASAYVGGNFAQPLNARVKTIDFNGGGQLDIGSIDYGVGGVTDGNDNLTGLSGQHYDLIVGLNGNDVIRGIGAGQSEQTGNVIIGGLGDDTIYTSGGDDQFAYDRGDGFDVITDAGGEDTLVFGSTVAAEDVIYEVVGNDLYIGAKDAANAALTASQVADHVLVVGGGVQSTIVDGSSGQVLGQNLNTIEYVLAGGTSIDLRKLNINWTQQVSYNYDYVAPIALDLDGDGLNLSSVEGSSVVVQTAQGGLSKIGWVGPADGFLAVDRNGDGAINTLSEISFAQDKPGATSDLEGLRTWDTNGDGLLDKADKDFSKILLFVDANQNGRSTAKELRTLEQAGIVAIDLGGQATGYTREMTTESFVQNTISFVWADGRTGQGYDVALARRVLGSEGLYAGDYQAEWGARDEDGTLGQLVNDPKAAAKATRIKARKGLLDKLGASYAEVKAAAQVDFSDNDRIDAAIAKRWTKMDASQQAAWLSGQATGMAGQKNLAGLKAISSGQALRNALARGAQAGQDLVAQGLSQAGAGIVSGAASGGAGASSATGGQTMANGLGVEFGSASGLGGLAASEPLDGAVLAGAAIGQDQAWWRGESGEGLAGAGSLAALLAAMDQGEGASTPGAPSLGEDPALLRQQALLRQAMAGFGGQAGGSAAIWNRDAAQPPAILAAASQPISPTSPNLAMAS